MKVFTAVSRSQNLVLGLVLALLIVFFIIAAIQKRRNAKLDELYGAAFEGDKASLQELTSHKDTHAADLMRRLLYDNNSSADRVTIYRALLRNGAINDKDLTQVLDIRAPAAARRAAHKIFLTDDCKPDCQRAALREVKDLYDGKLTSEEGELLGRADAIVNVERKDDLLQEARRAHSAAQADAMSLLRTNPCEGIRLANADPKADAAFRNWLEQQLQPGPSCS